MGEGANEGEGSAKNGRASDEYGPVTPVHPEVDATTENCRDEPEDDLEVDASAKDDCERDNPDVEASAKKGRGKYNSEVDASASP